MPVYTYECNVCGNRFEQRQGFNDAPISICPECEGAVHRVILPVGVVFKGSGFYINDKGARASSGTSTSGSKNESTAAKSESESGKSDKSDANKSDKTESGKSDSNGGSSKKESGANGSAAKSDSSSTPSASKSSKDSK